MHRAKEKSTGRIYVVKFVPTKGEAERNAVINEVNVMKQLNHPKLLHLHEFFSEPNESAMILEL